MALRARSMPLAHRHYGYRRIAALLGREGWQANHKRVLRLQECTLTAILQAKPTKPSGG